LLRVASIWRERSAALTWNAWARVFSA